MTTELEKKILEEIRERSKVDSSFRSRDSDSKLCMMVHEKADAGMFEESLAAAMISTRVRDCSPYRSTALSHVLECIRVTVETKEMDFIRVISLCEEALEVAKSVRCDGQCRSDAFGAVAIGTEKVLLASTKARLQKARDGELQKPDFKKTAGQPQAEKAKERR